MAGTGPTTVLNQTGGLKRIVNWVKNAYIEIQNRHGGEWKFLRHSFNVDTVADDDTYVSSDCTDLTDSAAISRFSHWRFDDPRDPPKIYLKSAGVGGERWMVPIFWEAFKSVYKKGTQNSGQPAHITVDPQDQFVIGAAPDGIYTITGDYYRSAQILTNNADVPEMPSQFHQLIVYEAMRKYALYESAPEVLASSTIDGPKLMTQLDTHQIVVSEAIRPMA